MTVIALLLSYINNPGEPKNGPVEFLYYHYISFLNVTIFETKFHHCAQGNRASQNIEGKFSFIFQ